MHLRDGHGLRQRDHKRLWENGVGDAHVSEFLSQGPKRRQAHAVGHFLVRNIGLVKLPHDAGHGPFFAVDLACAGASELFAVAVLQRRIVEKAVQKRSVRRVNAHFKGLQPIAVPQALEGKGVGAWGAHAVQRGQGRWAAALWAQPRKQNTTALLQRVVALLYALAQCAASRFCRSFQALPFHIKFPAVKGAAQAVALVAAKG